MLIILRQNVGVDVIAKHSTAEEVAEPSDLFWRGGTSAAGRAQLAHELTDLDRVDRLASHILPLFAMVAVGQDQALRGRIQMASRPRAMAA